VTYAPTPYSEIAPNVRALSGLSGCQRWSTVHESNATITARPADYRRSAEQRLRVDVRIA
jgi:hypothetical protein